MENTADFDVLGLHKIWSAWREIKTESIFLRLYNLAIYISTPGINFHTRISQSTHTLLWSMDGKPEIGLISPVWRHCWHDDFVGTWQWIL